MSETPQMQSGPKKTGPLLIILGVLAALIILCLCCIIAAFIVDRLALFDLPDIFDNLTSSSTASEPPTEVPGAAMNLVTCNGGSAFPASGSQRWIYEAEAGETITVIIQPLEGEELPYYTLYIHPEGADVFPNYVYPVNDKAVMTYTFPDSGTYIIRTRFDDDNTGMYELIVECGSGSDTAAQDPAYWDDQHIRLECGDSFSGEVNNSGGQSVDWYYFYADAGMEIVFDVTAGFEPDLTLRQADGSSDSLSRDEAERDRTYATVTVVALETAWYYVAVTSEFADEGSYSGSLYCSQAAAAAEPAESEPSADDVVIVEGPSEEQLSTGDIEVTATWPSSPLIDIDLWVRTPGGGEVYHSDPYVDNAVLEWDANADCYESSTTPTEHIYWPDGDAPSGSYDVMLEYWSGGACVDRGSVPVSVHVVVDGEVIYDSTVTMSYDGSPMTPETIFSFEYGGAN
ncbi:MAG: PPC domain-containing protein [Anaerolineae bacterium]|nr:PPC domain-containing protein [Anaerolineae bacterium]